MRDKKTERVIRFGVCSCDGCDEVFEIKKANQRYCSDRCGKRARAGWVPEEITCERNGCDAVFVTDKPGRRFCSDLCRGEHYKQISRVGPVEKRCAACGKVYEARQRNHKYCSECVGSRRKLGPVTKCVGCGKWFKAKRRQHMQYCSRECAFDHMSPLVNCVGCDVEYRQADGVAGGYCSDECRNTIVVGNCEICGEALYGSDSKRKYCSDECIKELNRRRAQEWARQQHIEAAVEYTCKQCGSVFCVLYGSHRRSYCSDQCAKRAAREREAAAGKRDSSHQQRARRYGNAYMYFDVVAEVLERDGWRCYLCGVDTPRELRGTIEDNAPEVDHVVPLSKGGDHVPWNCRCACRKCNIDKADNVLVWQQKQLDIRGRAGQIVTAEVAVSAVLASRMWPQVK